MASKSIGGFDWYARPGVWLRQWGTREAQVRWADGDVSISVTAEAGVTTFEVSTELLRRLLSAHGLHIVTDADKAVLKGISDVSDTYLRIQVEGCPGLKHYAAELARRASQPKERDNA